MSRVIMEKGTLKSSIDELILKIESMTQEEFRNHLDFVRRFYRYSPCNSMLIHFQLRTASIVQSCKKWNAMGRSIIRGEKAIRILAPSFRKFKETKKNDEDEDVVTEVERVRFVDVPVFDISQTEGAPIENTEIKGEFNDDTYNKIVSKLEANGFTVSVYPLPYDHGGYIIKGKDITLNANHSKVNNFSVLLHECSHSILDHQGERKSLTREQKELEAESTAYLLGKYFGLDIKSEFCLRAWGGQSKKLLLSLNYIVKAYRDIISMFEGDQNGNNTGNTQELALEDSSKCQCPSVR